MHRLDLGVHLVDRGTGTTTTSLVELGLLGRCVLRPSCAPSYRRHQRRQRRQSWWQRRKGRQVIKGASWRSLSWWPPLISSTFSTSHSILIFLRVYRIQWHFGNFNVNSCDPFISRCFSSDSLFSLTLVASLVFSAQSLLAELRWFAITAPSWERVMHSLGARSHEG